MLRVAARRVALVRPGIAPLFHVVEGTDCYVDRLSGADEGIAVLVLNRVASRNALSSGLLSGIRDAVSEILEDVANRSVRVVVVRSSVDGIFCAGADLKERLSMTPDQVGDFVSGIRRTFSQVEGIPVPTIAAIDGAALGGGLELALACDLRTAGARAKMGLPETKLAIIPGGGGTQRLPRVVGPAIAKQMIFTGAPVDAARALNLGLVNAIGDNGYEQALGLARQILPQGPVAVRMAKFAVNRGIEVDLASGLAIEEAAYAQTIFTEDRIEGLKAFLGKRAPVYHGK